MLFVIHCFKDFDGFPQCSFPVEDLNPTRRDKMVRLGQRFIYERIFSILFSLKAEMGNGYLTASPSLMTTGNCELILLL